MTDLFRITNAQIDAAAKVIFERHMSHHSWDRCHEVYKEIARREAILILNAAVAVDG